MSEATLPAESVEAERPRRESVGFVTASLALLTAALWGGTPVAVSFSQDQLPPVFTAGVRFALAAVFMLFWCRWEGCGLTLRRGQFWPAWTAASLLFVQIALFHVAIKWSNTSHATVLINTFVFWVAAIEHFVTRSERLSAGQAAGLAFAALGGATILVVQEGAGSRDSASLRGDLAMVASGLVLAIKIVYTKSVLTRIEPGKLIFWHDVFAVAMFFAWSAAFEPAPPTSVGMATGLGLIYQGVFVAGFCFALQTLLLRKHSASQISIYSVSTPIFGLVFSWWFRGDVLSPWLLFSVTCVAAGIVLVNRRPA